MAGLIFLAVIGYGIYFYFYKHFYVKVLSAGPNRDKVVQLIKNSTGWGLRESEDVVEEAPYIIWYTNLNYLKTRKVVADLKKAGASAQLVVHHFWQKAIKDGPVDQQ